MINKIPDDQKCQSFDPMMILSEKTNWIIGDSMKANTSCVAPAYIYMEGSRGKRFLCDYHYWYEKDITLERTPNLWNSICKILVNNIDDIRLTFPKVDKQTISPSMKCWCGAQAYVKSTIKREGGGINYTCNFHYRKMYYRCKSNGVNYYDIYDVVDERYMMKTTVTEEYDSLQII